MSSARTTDRLEMMAMLMKRCKKWGTIVRQVPTPEENTASTRGAHAHPSSHIGPAPLNPVFQMKWYAPLILPVVLPIT